MSLAVPRSRQRQRRKDELRREVYEIEGTEKFWAYGIHLSLLLFMINPLAAFIGPVWALLLHHGESPDIELQAREAFNFAATLAVAQVVASTVSAGMGMSIASGLTSPLLIAVEVFGLVGIGLAILGLRKDKPRRYPLCWRVMAFVPADDPHKNRVNDRAA